MIDFSLKFSLIPIGLLVGYLLKRYFSGGVCKSNKRLDGKVCVITGSNCGIGYETALDLAKRGVHVILACRDMKKAQLAQEKIIAESKNDKIDIEKLDCASFQSVREFADRFKSKYNHLDILINNAGLSQLGAVPPYVATVDGFETTIQVNHLGHFLLTNLLIDTIKSSAPSRIINVSSRAHLDGKINWDELNMQNTKMNKEIISKLYLKKKFNPYVAYAQSKLANVLFSMELAKRYKDDGITSVSLHPGVVTTEIWRNLEKMPFLSILIVLFKPLIWFTFKNCKEGAQTTLHCALDDDEVLRNNGKYFSDCHVSKISTEAKNENAEKLWNVSLALTGLDK